MYSFLGGLPWTFLPWAFSCLFKTPVNICHLPLHNRSTANYHLREETNSLVCSEPANPQFCVVFSHSCVRSDIETLHPIITSHQHSPNCSALFLPLSQTLWPSLFQWVCACLKCHTKMPFQHRGLRCCQWFHPLLVLWSLVPLFSQYFWVNGWTLWSERSFPTSAVPSFQAQHS